jgi:hypothetical protein
MILKIRQSIQINYIFQSDKKKTSLSKKIKSWKGFADSLGTEERRLFQNMLNDCYNEYTVVNR